MWARRFWSLGYSRVFLVLAILFAVIALVTPVWSLTQGNPASGDWSTTNSGWTSRTTDEFDSGALSRTTTEYYNAPGFDDPVLASAVAASYALIAVYLVVLAVVAVLFSTAWAKTMAPLLLMIVSIVVVLAALLALFYPLAAVPPAAAADLNNPAITGFWGSSSAPLRTWGAGLSWWLLLISVVLGCLGAGLPYLRSMRAAPMPQPRSWQPGR